MGIVDYSLKAKQAEIAFFNSNKVSDKNKQLISKFLDIYDVSPARMEIFMKNIAKFLSRVDNIKKDMKDTDKINKIFKELRDKYSPNYYNTIVNVSNRYVRWLNDGIKPKGFKDIRGIPKSKQRRNLKPDDMITWEEGELLINSTNSIQLKAIIAIQLDGGFRPSEFIDLDYGCIKQKGEFMIVHIKDGKTGSRNVILWRSVPHLSRWLQHHPSKKQNDSLWIQEHGEIKKYRYHAILKRIRQLGEKIKLEKPLDFYNLRHSACTISKIDNIPEEEAAKKFGHSIQYYTETYGRLTTEDSISRMGKAYGLKEEKTTIEKTITCSRCKFVNEPRNEMCSECGAPLTIKKAMEIDKKSNQEFEELKNKISKVDIVMNKLVKNPKILDLLAEEGSK